MLPCIECITLAACSGEIRNHLDKWYDKEEYDFDDLHELAEEVINLLIDRCSIMADYIGYNQDEILQHLNGDEIPEEYYKRYNGIMNYFSVMLPREKKVSLTIKKNDRL